jgi:hypothetical protein
MVSGGVYQGDGVMMKVEPASFKPHGKKQMETIRNT